MARLPLAPTKSSLLLVKARLATAREGHDLLEQKRLILAAEIMKRLTEVRQREAALEKETDLAYRALGRLFTRIGRRKSREMSQVSQYPSTVQPTTTLAAGMEFFSLEVSLPPAAPQLGLVNSPVETDRVTALFLNLLPLAAGLASLRAQVQALARELKKNQRRVNALEKIVIPQTEETRIYIENVLEEQERESFFARKRLKTKNQAPGGR